MMIIKISENGRVTLPAGNVLGYVGEHMLRVHKVIHPQVENAMYTMVLVYDDDTERTVNINDGEMVMTSSLLSAEGVVKAQFRATRNAGSVVHVLKSEVFTVKIMPSADV